MQKVIIIYVIVFLISMVGVHAIDFVFNYSEGTQTRQQGFLLTNGTENLTTSVSYGQYLSGVAQVIFSSTQASLDITISLPAGLQPTIYTTHANITDGFNYSVNITFNIEVVNSSISLPLNGTNTTIPLNSTEFIQIDINEFEYTTCDYLQPVTFSKNVVVAGRQGDVIQTLTVGNFFNVPNSFTIPPENFSIVNIGMTLQNLTPGSYTGTVRFGIVSEFDNVTFHFNIIDCLQPPPSLDKLLEKCKVTNLTANEYAECIAAQAKYYADLYTAIKEAQETKYINNTQKEYVNVTNRVPVLDLDNLEIVNAIKELPVTIKQLITDNRQKDLTIQQKDQENTELKKNVDKAVQEFNAKLEQTVDVLVEDNQRKQRTINFYQDKYLKKTTLYWGIFWTLIVGLSIWGFIISRENPFW